MYSSEKGNNKLSAGLIWSGTLIICVAIILLIINFAPIIKLEIDYLTKGRVQGISTDNTVASTFDELFNSTDNSELHSFMLFVPAIDAKSLVVSNVDPIDSKIYSEALNYGIAHAQGTALPGELGNTFLFAHSGRNFYENTHQNVQFYLLEKLAIEDIIYIKYFDNIYKYKVIDTLKVWPNETQYLTEQDFSKRQLTLMSCWPAGMNYKRQIVQAALIETFAFPNE